MKLMELIFVYVSLAISDLDLLADLLAQCLLAVHVCLEHDTLKPDIANTQAD